MFPAGTMALLGSGALALTAFTAFDIDASFAEAGFRFETDGSISRNQGGSFSQVNPGEWWTPEPEVAIGSSYEVRYTGANGNYNFASAAAANVWVTMNVSRYWALSQSGTGNNISARTFELSVDGAESADASATLTIDVEVF